MWLGRWLRLLAARGKREGYIAVRTKVCQAVSNWALVIGRCDIRNLAVSRMYLLKMMTLELRAIHVEIYTAGWKDAESGSERFWTVGFTVGSTGWAGSRAASSDARTFSSDIVAECGVCMVEGQQRLLLRWRPMKGGE